MTSFRRSIIAAVVLVACALSYAPVRDLYALFCEDQSRAAQHELSLLVPKIASVTIYDFFHHHPSDSQSLTGAISAQFPEDVFTRAAALALHQNTRPIWKGSALAVLKLRDGSERRAHFSYYGNFFTLEGTPGKFVCPESAGFGETFHCVIIGDFFPQREARNQKQRREQKNGLNSITPANRLRIHADCSPAAFALQSSRLLAIRRVFNR